MILRDEKIVTTIIKYINSKKDIKRYFDFSYKSQKHKIYDQLVEIINVGLFGFDSDTFKNYKSITVKAKQA